MIRSESFSRGMLFSVIFNAGAKGLLFLLTILIAHFFGTSTATDIYFFISAAMLLLSGLVNAVDTTVLVPVSMRIRKQEGDVAAMAFLNVFLLLYVLAGLIFSAIVWMWAVPLFSFFSRFSDADILQYRHFFLLGSLLFLLQVLTGYINNILASLRFFTVPMIVSGINSCLVIAGILLLHHDYDVFSVLIGSVVAYAVNLMLLLLLMKRLTGWKFSTLGKPSAYAIWGRIGFTGLGQVFTLASSYFPLYLLSGFGNGIISAMSYGKQLADAPNSLFTSQLTNVGGVALNEEAAAGNRQKLAHHFTRTGRLLLFIMIPIGLYLLVFARPVVELLYRRGRFDEATVTGAAMFLRFFASVLFVIALNAWVSRVFIALQAIRQAFIYQLVMNSIFMVMTWLFTRYYEAYGYGYAYAAFYLLNFILMYFVCRWLARDIDYAGLAFYALRLLLINGVIATAFYFLLPYVSIPSWLQLLLSFLLWLALLVPAGKKIIARNS